jgi:hypothetical protein
VTGGREFSLSFLRRLPLRRAPTQGLISPEIGNEDPAERKPLEHVEQVKPR